MKNLKNIILILFVFSALFAEGGKGKIAGKVTDKATGEGLPSVNIIIKGTYYGAASDFDGNFEIKNITEGNYIIEASLIGFKKVQFTNIRVFENRTVKLNIELEESVLSLEQDVVVIGEKPLVDIEETQSKKTVSREDIAVAVVENVADIVTQQAGVVKSDNAIHIRGGRSYENAFLLDGVSIQDPLAGTGFGLNLSSNSIQEMEVITGGFNAEYGQATSGIVNVRTREGSDKYSGFLSYKVDNYGNKESFHVFNSDIYEANLSGPEPITTYLLPLLGIKIPGRVSFFSSFYGGFSDGITQGYKKATANQLYSSIYGGTRFAPKAQNNWFYLGKITYNYSPTFKIRYSFNHSAGINQNSQSLQSRLEYVQPSPGYQYNFQNNLDNANTFTHTNTVNTLSLTHTLNSKTFYELKLSHFFTKLRADANGLPFSESTEPQDIVTFPIEYYNERGDTIGVIPGDGFYDTGNPYTWHDHYVEDISLKGDLTSFFDEKNKFKAGFDVFLTEMQLIDIYKPWIGEMGLNNDFYKVNPARGAFYAQDNINFSGMIINFGMRLDYWFPGKYVDDAVANPEVVTIPDELRQQYYDDSFKLFGRYFKARLSPRLGISHPVSDNQILFFSYGHFSKWPKPQFVYAKLSPLNAQSSFQRFGNPNLNAETTVAYELGLKTQITNDDVLTITTYYKDIFDYVRTRTANINSPRFSSQNFITYANLDYARSRGLEIEYKKRIGKWFTGSANFSYSIVTGKSSSDAEGVLILKGDLDASIKEDYMPWDRPITASANLNFYLPKGEGLFGFGKGILDDLNLYLRIFYESGKRYTAYNFTGDYLSDGRPEYEIDRKNYYGSVGENWFWVDMNFEKYVKFAGLKLTFFLEVNNLFDTQNSAIINPVTGKAYENGDDVPNSWNDPKYPQLQAPISPYPFNPARYLTRRNIKFGMSLYF